jgi:phosphatidylglycerol:prolipoprotein diacylglycerol transferase
MDPIALLTSTIRVNLDPFIHVGPFDIAWHGLMSAVGILTALYVAVRYARRIGLEPDPLYSFAIWMSAAGLLGARVLFLMENDMGALLDPSMWFGSQGFSIYGGIIGGGLAAAVLVSRRNLSVRYFDAIAAGFPLGMAVGRIGDLINGEHYGQASNVPWAIQYVHPAAPVPSPDIAYHAGGLYEVLLALVIASAVWLLRDHLRRRGELLWTVIGLYGAGRFAMFYYRVDSEPFALGLDTSQWISLALVAISLLGFWVIRHPAYKRKVIAGAVSLVLLGGGLGSLAGCYGGDEARASTSRSMPPYSSAALPSTDSSSTRLPDARNRLATCA